MMKRKQQGQFVCEADGTGNVSVGSKLHSSFSLIYYDEEERNREEKIQLLMNDERNRGRQFF